MKFGIKGKLFGVVGVVSLAFTIGALVAWNSYLKSTEASERQSQEIGAIYKLEGYQNAILTTTLAAMDMLVNLAESRSADSKVDNELVSEVEENWIKISEESAVLEKFAKDLKFEDDFQKVEALKIAIFDQVRKMITSINSGDRRGSVYEKYDETIDSSTAAAIELTKSLTLKLDESFKTTSEQALAASTRMLTSTFTAFLLSLGLLWFVGIPIIVQVSRSIEETKDLLLSTTQKVRLTSSRLSSASQEMASASTESAASIQESVSAMTEMASMLSQTAHNVMETTEIVRGVHTQSNDGTQTMKNMTGSMADISRANSRLKEIVKIINDISGKTNVINDIVFKTQLLSVNASIEAARAGQHGKGFAVVANEVASLATLSGKASSEIRELLKSSNEKVAEIIEETTLIVKKGEVVSVNASDTFASIAESVAAITDRVEQISEASKEQETGVQQTTLALSQMNSTTSTTSSTAQENANLSQQLLEQSMELENVGHALGRIVYGDGSHGREVATKRDNSEALNRGFEPTKKKKIKLKLLSAVSKNQYIDSPNTVDQPENREVA